MKYPDGQEAIIGDKVMMGGDEGEVVCSIDNNEYSEEYSKEGWGSLGHGVLIRFPTFGLIHFTEPDSDLKLISRKTESTP
jgi:hypothetical protein